MELAAQDLGSIWWQIIVILGAGLSIPFLLYPILVYWGKFKVADAASIAAHYGSISIGTFAVAIAFLEQNKINYQPQITVFAVILEFPAIIAGILLAKGKAALNNLQHLGQEVFLGKSIVLLLGSLSIGFIGNQEQLNALKPLFFDLFSAILCLFMLEMGLVVARQLKTVASHGWFLIGFAFIAPICLGTAAVLLATLIGFDAGSKLALAALFASASYIAVPAAMRMAVPQAVPALSLGAALAITFPFNIMVGIPFIYYPLALF